MQFPRKGISAKTADITVTMSPVVLTLSYSIT